MTEERLRELLAQLKNLNIVVVGDLFLDRWWEVNNDLDEPSVETGITAYQITGRRFSAGAAGTVINNLAALGVGRVGCVSMLGQDGEGYEVLKCLKAIHADTSHIVRSARIMTPTYTKPMFRHRTPEGISPETEGHRFDIKNHSYTPQDLLAKMIGYLKEEAAHADAIIALDQLTDINTGVITYEMRQALSDLSAQYPGLLIYADSRAFLSLFENVVVKCNDSEAWQLFHSEAYPGFDETLLSDCLTRLHERSGKPSLITCGAKGILVEDPEHPGQARLVPAIPVTGPIDIVGCGDACSAGLVSAWAAGASMTEAAEMGNLTASVTIKKIGTTGTASPEEVLHQYQAHTDHL